MQLTEVEAVMLENAFNNYNKMSLKASPSDIYDGIVSQRVVLELLDLLCVPYETTDILGDPLIESYTLLHISPEVYEDGPKLPTKIDLFHDPEEELDLLDEIGEMTLEHADDEEASDAEKAVWGAAPSPAESRPARGDTEPIAAM